MTVALSQAMLSALGIIALMMWPLLIVQGLMAIMRPNSGKSVDHDAR
jgi:hypothetical protein